MPIETVFLKPTDIEVRNRLRPLDQAHVEQIAASMSEIGQLEPIIVTTYADSDAEFTLVAGYHRLGAVIKADLDTVRAEWVDPELARIIEIDENLCRRELSALDSAIFLAERKKLWEEMHPEAAHGKAKKPKDGKVANLATFTRFSKDAAQRTGLSERSVQRATELAGKIAPAARDMLRLSSIADNRGQLAALAELDFEEQLLVAQQIADGKAKNVNAAKIEAGLTPRPRAQDKTDKQKTDFLTAWARMSDDLRTFVLQIATQWKDGCAEGDDTTASRKRKAV